VKGRGLFSVAQEKNTDFLRSLGGRFLVWGQFDWKVTVMLDHWGNPPGGAVVSILRESNCSLGASKEPLKGYNSE
jgi:hypothetical protein